MNLSKKILIAVFIVIVLVSISLVDSFVSTAEAKVGRPLTPVSVAGVARRTSRRN